jgi:CheY-like chemotaxis protein
VRTLVLVVDDHPANRTVLLSQIEMLGYAVESADGGVEALEAWKTRRFAAVVTDCNMPGLDGFGLAREIRAHEEREGLPRTPIIACTANALAGEGERCRAAGMDDYLAKPVELSQLAGKMGRWLPLPDDAHLVEVDARAGISLNDAAKERDILARFHAFTRQDAAMIRNAFARGDSDALVHACHRTKGAARTFGAHAVALACETIEKNARIDDWSGIGEAMKSFEHAIENLDTYLESKTRPPGV